MNDDDDGAAALGKLILFIVVVTIALAAAIFLGGPLLALYTLAKGWDNVTTRVKVGAIGLPLVGAGLAVYSIGQNQISSWDWASVFLLSSPFISLGMVGIAYYREKQKFALPNLPLPAASLERVCAHCGAANRPGFKHCSACGKAAFGVTRQIKGP